MKRFSCPLCQAEVHFDSLSCLRCGTGLAYAPGPAEFRPLPGERAPCANRGEIGCNWEAGPEPGALCEACVLTETIPDLSVPGNALRWARIEDAKRRLVYSLRRLGLPFEASSGERLRFQLLGDEVLADGSVRRVLTGHDSGVVTLNVAEADAAAREATRVAMGEPYRTLLGHVRHEVGHFCFDVLVEEGGRRAGFDGLFGDPGQDYGEALRRHYDEGAPPGWAEAFVSAYASSHPWEDWAETWAHWLHMVDGLETAAAYGLVEEVDPHAEPSAERLVALWVPLSIAVNAMNRAVGQADFYPFVLAPRAVEKIAFVHGLRPGAT